MFYINFINLFLGAFVSVVFYIFIIKKIFCINTTKNIYLLLPMILILISIVNFYDRDTFKILMTIPILTIYFKYLFDIKIEDSFIYILVATFYMFIGELLVGIMFSLLPISYSYIFENVLGGFIGSIFVVIFTFPLIYITFLSELIKKLINQINKNTAFFFGLIFLVLLGGLTYRNIHNLENYSLIYVNLIIFLSFLVFIHILLKQSKKIDKITYEYKLLINYLEKYEKELENKRKITHDYNNQLIVINGYISKNNKKLKSYVSELIKDQSKIKNDKLIYILDKIPKGFKDLIYYKFSNIYKKINLNILIYNNLSKINKIDSRLTKDLLKIFGILIDNSIEAISKSKQKDINIEFYLKNNVFEINIENSYNGNIEKSKIFSSGYSTKGRNRGYGLSIIKDIVSKNKNININYNIIDETFKAILKAKI